MQSFASLSKRIIPAIVLMLVLLIALAIPAGAHDSTGDSVFVSIRHYAGLDPDGQDELYRLTAEGFLPLIRESEGYIGYFWLHEGENVVAVSLFESQEQASASSASAREYVAENLAHLVEGPPRTVEGNVDIGFVELLDGMGDGAVSSLHASVRVYDDFEADDLDEFVTIVEDGFLPIMRETDGFFGYYLMNDGADTVTAISIFDSEASSLESNENAREFVAENLTVFLPSAPVIVSGRVGIASLADLNDGANLIDDEPVFVSIRVYDGVDPMDRDEIVRLVDPVFLSIMRESDGFVGYYLLPAGDKLAAVSMFDSAEQAAASNEKARDYVAEFMAPLLPNDPMIVEDHIDVMYVNDADDMMTPELYASLRIYHVSDMDRLEETNELVKAYLLPALHEAGGLFSYYSLHAGDGTIAGLNVYATEANALAANDIAAAFIAEHNMDWLPDDPTRVNGQLGVAALAGIQMGENLVGAMRDDSVFASVRVYDGIDPANQAEITRLTTAGFLPIMRESDGFVGYYLMPAEDQLAAISLFDSAEQAAASTDKAREFVVENLAPLLPNPPLIVEGTVEVSALLAADNVDATMAMPLHALLVIYDGFDMARLDETAALIESVLLPDLREDGGLFGYFGISDGVDKTVALRIMDSEESLQRGSDIAADFVAEYLSDWLPDDPLNVSGPLGIAARADLNMGENLAKWDMTEEVFASVRVYDGVDPANQAEIASLTAEGFLPIMRESDGFVGYYLMPAGESLAAISLFDSAEQAAASTERARDFVVENLAPLLPNAPTVVEGPLSIYQVAALSGAEGLGGDGELYASIRLYEGFDLTHIDEANGLALTHLLPALQDLGGLFAQFALNDGEDTVVGISIFDNEDGSLASNDVGKAFTMEYLADWAPNPPTGVSGELAIAAQANINMGENLVGAMMEG